ncbi:addiction module protein [Nitrosovibrio sp. Nv17]|uniref:addiction module protein n=1 Tax=Nitrosovibrio sp. Nv17 TaxID=1855339 RepID=UPI0035199CBE
MRKRTPARKLELLEPISESLEQDEMPVSSDARAEVESRLKTCDENRKTTLPWGRAAPA